MKRDYSCWLNGTERQTNRPAKQYRFRTRLMSRLFDFDFGFHVTVGLFVPRLHSICNLYMQIAPNEQVIDKRFSSAHFHVQTQDQIDVNRNVQSG